MANVATEDIISKIIAKVPQRVPFRFIDKVLELSENSCVGEYTFKKKEFFYEGHFPGNPITPGVILTETMAQIGVIPIALYREFLKTKLMEKLPIFFLSETDIEFQKPVLPGQCVTVKGEIIYSKYGKVKSKVVMENSKEETVSIGTVAGFAAMDTEK